jgi:hypothetical protein
VEAPAAYKNAAMANMIGGGITILFSLMWILAFIWICVGLLWVVPMAAGGYQLYIGMDMNKGEANPASKNAAIAGLIGSVCTFNIISIAASAFAFMQIGDDEVAGWIESNS